MTRSKHQFMKVRP